MKSFLLAVILLASCPFVLAQQALNNDSVARMVKAGLSDDLIITTVNASSGTFDTSADGLIALKTAGASDKVVSAIVLKASAHSQNTQPSSSPSSTPSPATDSGEQAQQQQPSEVPAVQEPTDKSNAPVQNSGKPRVFLQSASKGSNQNAARDQSMEMSKDFEKNCQGVRVTINQQMADYTVLLNHIEVGLLVRDNQFQLANKDGDLISKTKEGGSIAAGMKKVCQSILDDWAKK